MALDFPTSPSPNQVYTAGAKSWSWDNTSGAWLAVNAGIQGTQGTQGALGTQGAQGLQGITGANGSNGSQGTQGIQGLLGIQGAQGTQGLQGIQGIQGIEGIQGTQGIQGLQGTAGFVGSNGAQGTQGEQGIQGIQGIQGTQGTQGIQGTQGTQGIQGIQGTQGTQGIQGIQGIQGTQGTQGLQGIQGIQGITGIQGAIGSQGTQGTQGLQGIQGISGASILGTNNNWTGINTFTYNGSEAIVITGTSAASTSLKIVNSNYAAGNYWHLANDSQGGFTLNKNGSDLFFIGRTGTTAASFAGALSVTGTLGTTGTITGNIDNGYVLLNRSSTSYYVGVNYRTASAEKWFTGLRENLTSNNYVIYNAATSHDVLTLNTTTDAANFYGNVGIGKATPASKLDISGSHTSGYGIITVTSTDSSLISLDSSTTYDNGMRLKYQGGDKWLVGIRGDDSFTFSNASDVRRLAITQTGNVGIGTTTPQTKLQVITPTTASVPAAGTYGGAAIFSNDLTAYGLYVGSISNGNGYIQQQRGDAATYYNILLQPNGGNVTIGSTSASFKLDVTGTVGKSGRTVPSVAIQSGATTGTPAAVQNGDFWWNTDTGVLNIWYSTASAWIAATPVPDSTVFFRTSGGNITGNVAIQGLVSVTGNIQATGTITGSYSDERLKDVSGNIKNALSKVMLLNGVEFKPNDTAKYYGFNSDESEVGVIAQQVQAVLPEVVKPAPFDSEMNDDGVMVSKSGENYITVQYERMVPLLIEAIKEQQAQIEKLNKALEKFIKE
jgi:hypothetical protein